jgi:hypothetical protein
MNTSKAIGEDCSGDFFFFFLGSTKKWFIWYKVERICVKKRIKKSCIVVSFFNLNGKKKLLMWYKKWKKLKCFKVDFFFLEAMKIRE